ncbi:MAG: cupin domain-containing protein [Planctomycetota bacterium]
MNDSARPVAVLAASVAPRAKASNYPEPFAARVAGREKRALGDVFGLVNFGVSHVRIAPGSMSALRHAHRVSDEFVYVLEGTPTLRTDAGETVLAPGMCAGFRAGTGNGWHLVNHTDTDVVCLIVGDRLPGDGASYPDDDLAVERRDGEWRFSRKDGTPYG